MSHAPTPPLSGDGPARMSSYFEALNVLTHLFRVFNRRESHATRGIEAGVAINRNKLMALILDYVIFWHSPQRPTSYLDIFFRSLKRDDFALNFSLGGSLRFLKKRGGRGGGGGGEISVRMPKRSESRPQIWKNRESGINLTSKSVVDAAKVNMARKC